MDLSRNVPQSNGPVGRHILITPFGVAVNTGNSPEAAIVGCHKLFGHSQIGYHPQTVTENIAVRM